MASYTYEHTPLAQGGEKVVYRGRCVETGDVVVVKFLRRPYTQADVQRFSTEIERLGRAKHGAGAGIATLIDSNISHDPPFYVEEYFPDGTLAKKMADIFALNQVFQAGAAVGYCRQILVALGGVHSTNQIHRDVKPANILVRGHDKTLVLSDMGIGRTLDRATVLQTRMFIGTRGYAAPEQEAGLPVDHRADLYSVGVILHEMLTQERGSHSSITYNESPRVRAVLQRLLALNRNFRFASARDAADAISALGIATR